MMARTPEIAEGAAFLVLTCPECGRQTAPIVVTIGARLTVDSLSTDGALKPVMKAKAVPHNCHIAGVVTEPLFPVTESA